MTDDNQTNGSDGGSSDSDCQVFASQLHLYVGADLEEQEQARTTTHLARCEPCRERWRRAVEAREALLTLRGSNELAGASESGQGLQLWSSLRGQLQAEGLFKEASAGPIPMRPIGMDMADQADSAGSPVAQTPIRSLAGHRRKRAWSGWVAAAGLAILTGLAVQQSRMSTPEPSSSPLASGASGVIGDDFASGPQVQDANGMTHSVGVGATASNAGSNDEIGDSALATSGASNQDFTAGVFNPAVVGSGADREGAQPLFTGDRLRRLEPGEKRWSESAVYYPAFPFESSPSGNVVPVSASPR